MLRTLRRRRSESARTYLDFTSRTTALDAAAELVADTLGFANAQINILDGSTMYVLADYGPFTDTSVSNASQPATVCGYTIDAGHIVVIPDARRPTATGDPGEPIPPAVRQIMITHGALSYLGTALIGREGLPVGTLCVFDSAPHRVTDRVTSRLELLATLVEELLDAHRDRSRPPLDHSGVAALNAALAAGEIVPWYQPIVDVETGFVVALEALARWDHPTRGLLTPAHFLDVAEASELIIDVDLCVIARSLADLRTWHEIDDTLRMHVNLSGAHFAHHDCIERLTTLVRAAGLTPASIVLEITEVWALIGNPSNTEFVTGLGRAGFEVVLDDLGTGWSSVDRFLEFPVAGFKVDKVVTDRLGTPEGDAVSAAFHTLATDLDLDLTVEGVETADQAQALVAMGSVHGQGYWWSRPIQASDVAGYLDRHRRTHTDLDVVAVDRHPGDA
ncbi:EAL domain-containing protein [Rhodococcoides fascians]|uniref:EAL domain-containing protein n=1 Tax=Rhodococcoides fascians TaxID=1828 RepID=UPI00055CB1D5|nr:EAL domain-containing protein [Rhodococcus fascians]